MFLLYPLTVCQHCKRTFYGNKFQATDCRIFECNTDLCHLNQLFLMLQSFRKRRLVDLQVHPGIKNTWGNQYDFSKCRTRKRRRKTLSKKAASKSRIKPNEDDRGQSSSSPSDQPLIHEQNSDDFIQPEKPANNPSAISLTSSPQESSEVCH